MHKKCFFVLFFFLARISFSLFFSVARFPTPHPSLSLFPPVSPSRSFPFCGCARQLASPHFKKSFIIKHMVVTGRLAVRAQHKLRAKFVQQFFEYMDLRSGRLRFSVGVSSKPSFFTDFTVLFTFNFCFPSALFYQKKKKNSEKECCVKTVFLLFSL